MLHSLADKVLLDCAIPRICVAKAMVDVRGHAIVQMAPQCAPVGKHAQIA